MIYLKFILKFLPELFSLVKSLVELTQQGVQDITIRNNLKRIEKAFKAKNRVQAARELNDVFRQMH